MTDYSIGEVEHITGIKAHVLRYWEEVIPFIRPRKDNQGRRYYSKRDLALIERIKYLVQIKKFTLEGAGEQLIRELTENPNQKQIQKLQEVRDELLDMFWLLKKSNL